MSTDFFIHAFSLFLICLLFTPFPVTRFAMHRIYAERINSRDMSRVFCDLCSQKTRGMLPMNSNLIRPLLIHLPSHKIHTLLLTTWILLSYPRSRYMSDSVKRGSSDRCLSLLPQLPSQHSRHTGFSPTRQVPADRPFAPHNTGNLHPERDRKNKYVF